MQSLVPCNNQCLKRNEQFVWTYCEGVERSVACLQFSCTKLMLLSCFCGKQIFCVCVHSKTKTCIYDINTRLAKSTSTSQSQNLESVEKDSSCSHQVMYYIQGCHAAGVMFFPLPREEIKYYCVFKWTSCKKANKVKMSDQSCHLIIQDQAS